MSDIEFEPTEFCHEASSVEEMLRSKDIPDHVITKTVEILKESSEIEQAFRKKPNKKDLIAIIYTAYMDCNMLITFDELKEKVGVKIKNTELKARVAGIHNTNVYQSTSSSEIISIDARYFFKEYYVKLKNMIETNYNVLFDDGIDRDGNILDNDKWIDVKTTLERIYVDSTNENNKILNIKPNVFAVAIIYKYMSSCVSDAGFSCKKTADITRMREFGIRGNIQDSINKVVILKPQERSRRKSSNKDE